MGIELVWESFAVDKVMARATAQAEIRGTRDIPEVQPGVRGGAVSAILRVMSRAVIDEIRVSDDVVEVDGRVEVEILYVGDSERTGEQFVRRKLDPLPFAKRIETEGITIEVTPRVEAHVHSLDIATKSSRRIDLEAIVDLTVFGVVRERQEVAKGITGVSPESVSVVTEPLRVTDRIGSGTAICNVVANRSLPSGYPPILQGYAPVIAVTAIPRILDSSVQDDKVRVEGELDVTVVYQADPDYCDPAYPVYSVTFTGLGFSQTVGVPDAVPHNRAFASARVVSADALRVTGDMFDISVALEIGVDVIDVKEIPAIVGVESLGEEIVDTERRQIRTFHTVSEERTEAMLTGSVQLPDGFPSFYGGDEPAILAKTADIRIDSCKPQDGRVVIEGTLDIDVVYACETSLDEEFENRDQLPPVRAVRFESIPFDYTIDMADSHAGMIGEAWGNVADLSVDPLPDHRRLEYSAVVNIGLRVLEVRQFAAVTDCDLVEPQERDPAVITYYVAQEGDSLWKIARRYKITVDSLVNENHLESRDELKPGLRLRIPAI